MQRNRGLEAAIPRDYLERLNEHYLAWYDSYDISPRIRIDTDLEPLDRPQNVPPIVARIEELLK